jgi:hypothetical protein
MRICSVNSLDGSLVGLNYFWLIFCADMNKIRVIFILVWCGLVF